METYFKFKLFMEVVGLEIGLLFLVFLLIIKIREMK